MFDFIIDAWNYLNSLNPGLSLAALGYVGYICRQVPEKIWALIDQNFSVSFQSTSTVWTFYKLTCEYLITKCPKLANHPELTAFRARDKVGSNDSYAFTDGSFSYMLDPLTYIFITKGKVQSLNDVAYNIYVKVIGLNRYKILNEYKKYLTEEIDIKSKYFISTEIFSNSGYSEFYVRKKYFKDIYLHSIPDITKIIDTFLANEKIYNEHGITHKLGICFYGPGGVGKSVLCRAIATYLNWPICIIKNNGPYTKFPEPEDYNEKKIFVLEELDLYCDLNRSAEEYESMANKGQVVNKFNVDGPESIAMVIDRKRPVEKSQSIVLQNLLTFLDGINSPHNCIIIATTNYIDRIDPILLRPGRFDYKFELTFMDRDRAVKMCNNFNVPVEEILKDVEFPCSPAIVQNNILQYINRG